jgi:hypothetical protein
MFALFITIGKLGAETEGVEVYQLLVSRNFCDKNFTGVSDQNK